MEDNSFRDPVPALKDGKHQRPIPTEWRAVLRDVVRAFAVHDYQINCGIPAVSPVSVETAQHIQNYIRDYGATLAELPEETWRTSVCIWSGGHWDVLIDLWTREEGQSDLVLAVQVTEDGSAFAFKIQMIYVP